MEDHHAFPPSPYTQEVIPYRMQPDERLPPPGVYPSNPISLVIDGYESHYLVLLAPRSADLVRIMQVARAARRSNIHMPYEDVVWRALDRKKLDHISDGPSGGIWVVEAGNEEVVWCMVEDLGGGWEVLGIGKGMCDGQIFLRHPCGFGPDIEVGVAADVEEEERKANSSKEKATMRNIQGGSSRDKDEREVDMWPFWNKGNDPERHMANPLRGLRATPAMVNTQMNGPWWMPNIFSKPYAKPGQKGKETPAATNGPGNFPSSAAEQRVKPKGSLWEKFKDL